MLFIVPVCKLCFTRHYKDAIGNVQINDFNMALFHIYWSTSVPKIVKIRHGLVSILILVFVMLCFLQVQKLWLQKT